VKSVTLAARAQIHGLLEQTCQMNVNRACILTLLHRQAPRVFATAHSTAAGFVDTCYANGLNQYSSAGGVAVTHDARGTS
jgi:hypothetical protein